ncbi:bifunctional DNA primase/polymerase [Streptomyces sp. HNM0663]|uniref:Bifunctional DNA primase/polymerase n=2 Tax=Streptomyces chengmaiensis TaxID=3040919 RepID=A0ABT6HHC3_9ACTN|nr:bifunctional DNA primase/polymerase [Streptomyces chengmaiensis]
MHHNTPRPLRRAALEAAERGWHVFPLVPGSKRPAVRSWEQRATVDAERLTRCWATGDYNIGIAAGPSRLVIVDLDVPKHDGDLPPAGTPDRVADGADSLALLAELQGGRYPCGTYTVRTPSGGTHLYFTAPAGTALRNTAGTLGWKVDTRANGGYVVGAGSTVDSEAYTVADGTVPAALPDWLARLLTPAPLPRQEPLSVPLLATDRRGAYLRAAVDGELQRVACACEGNRNNALYQASVALGQLVAGQALNAGDVTGWLVEAAVRIGLAEQDARRTIASGQRAGAKKPRSIAGRAA